MRFLDELKEKRQDAIENVAGIDIDIEATKITLKSEQERRAFWTKRIAEIDIAIAALKAADDHAYFAEQETAREQLEREPEIPAGFTKWEGGVCPVDSNTCISVMFLDGEISHDGVIAGHMNWAHDVSCAARIYAYRVTEQASVQDETLDQGASEPVVRASPGEVEESRDQSTDEQDDASEFAEPVEERPALNEQMQDEREEPVELPQPEWNEPQPTDGYAPVTNPAADEAAKAHDWYDPKAVAERQRFNPWGGVSNLFGKPKVDA